MAYSTEAVLQGEELMDLVRSQLTAGQRVRYLPFRGVSMLPMLRQGKDSVEVAPVVGKLKKYDLPVYQYPSGKYVMHRIVGVREDCYICLGDNTYQYEFIRPEQILGVVSAFRRGERRIEADAWGYRLYARVWYWLYPLRRPVRMLAGWGKSMLRRLLKWGKHP